jgi:integrase
LFITFQANDGGSIPPTRFKSESIENKRIQPWRFNGHRHYLSLGVADTKTARAMAEMKAKQIELDILSGNFR